MKAKELQTGVVYINRSGDRKGVVVTLDATYQKPPKNIHRNQKVLVAERVGNGAGYLVLEAPLNYPDETLLEDAASLQKPVIGEVWPYVISDTAPYSHRRPNLDTHYYPALKFAGVEYTTEWGLRKAFPDATIWLAPQFLNTYAQYSEDVARHIASVEAQRQALRDRQESAQATSDQLYNRIRLLDLEGIELEAEQPRPQNRPDGVYVLLRSDVVDALLKCAED